jgi:chromosome segregation ATPase
MGYGLDAELVADERVEVLASLNQRYRGAREAAAAARAEYWALKSEPDTQLAELESTRRQWQRLEYRRHEIASQIGQLQD